MSVVRTYLIKLSLFTPVFPYTLQRPGQVHNSADYIEINNHTAVRKMTFRDLEAINSIYGKQRISRATTIKIE